MSLISLILLAAVALNTILGLFVFLRKTKTVSNIEYFVLVIFVSIWISMNYLVEFVNTQTEAWLLAAVAYVSILGIAYAFLLFCYYFPQRTFTWPRVVRFLTLFITALVGASIFVPGFAINTIVISPWKINTGPGVNILFLTFIILMVAAFTILIRKLANQKLTQQERLQLRLVLTGSMTATVLGAGFNLLLPFIFHNYDYVRIGPIFTLIMVACIAIAIVRYHLFNIKVIATQTFAVLLCVAQFVRTLAAITLQEQLIDAGLLIITLFVCVLLVRNALKEVEQREALAVANDGKTNLIRIMNHQIKGRLGGGKNIFAELLSGDYGKLPDTAKPLLRKGLDEMDTGVNYIQTILRGMSAENGTLSYDMRPIDLRNTVEQAVETQRNRAEEKGLYLHINCASAKYGMLGDTVQLKEVVRNLVDNAIAYTARGGITVTLQREDSTLLLAVKDTGAGIPEADRPRLFTAGGRGKNSVQINVDSTGYGLAFVKGAIEAHNGKVWYQSDGIPGHGTTFFVKIPTQSAQFDEAPPRMPSPNVVEADA